MSRRLEVLLSHFLVIDHRMDVSETSAKEARIMKTAVVVCGVRTPFVRSFTDLGILEFFLCIFINYS